MDMGTVEKVDKPMLYCCIVDAERNHWQTVIQFVEYERIKLRMSLRKGGKNWFHNNYVFNMDLQAQ